MQQIFIVCIFFSSGPEGAAMGDLGREEAGGGGWAAVSHQRRVAGR